MLFTPKYLKENLYLTRIQRVRNWFKNDKNRESVYIGIIIGLLFSGMWAHAAAVDARYKASHPVNPIVTEWGVKGQGHLIIQGNQ